MLAARSHWTRAAALAAGLTILHTWPLATAPHVLSRNTNADALLNQWILTWVQHQLPRDPTRLFQANIFYPAPDALAFSEPLIAPALLAAPVRVAGGSPLLVSNVVLLAGFMLTMLATYALVREWTGDELAALAAASAFAFNTHTLTRLAHVQALHAYGLPLALLAADRVLTRRRTRDALWLSVWTIVLAYTSGYLAVAGYVMLLVVFVARMREWIAARWTVLPRLAVAAILAALAVVPLYLPYRRVANEQGMIRTLEEAAGFSASVSTYLASASTLHWTLWASRMWPDAPDRFFPGILVLALTVAGIVLVWRHGRDSLDRTRVVMLVCLGVAGVLLSFGPRTPVYDWAYDVLPGFSSLRAPARFGVLLLLSTAALAGFGLAFVRRMVSPRSTKIIGIGAVLVVTIEAVRAPITYTPFGGFSNVYSLLKAEPQPVVLVEVPFYPPEAVHLNAAYVVNSTVHWRPLFNGYSGYTPPGYADLAATFRAFPDDTALEAMRRAGATHVVVHPNRFRERGDEVRARSDASPRLERIAADRDGVTLYRLR